MLIRLTVCSLCIISNCLVVSHYGIEGGTVVLTALVPGGCLHFRVDHL